MVQVFKMAFLTPKKKKVFNVADGLCLCLYKAHKVSIFYCPNSLHTEYLIEPNYFASRDQAHSLYSGLTSLFLWLQGSGSPPKVWIHINNQMKLTVKKYIIYQLFKFNSPIYSYTHKKKKKILLYIVTLLINLFLYNIKP